MMEALPNPSVHRTCMSATISGVQKRTTTAAERQRHIQIRLRLVKCFAIILCGSRFVPNKRNVLSLAWHESLSCKGKKERFTAAGGRFHQDLKYGKNPHKRTSGLKTSRLKFGRKNTIYIRTNSA